MGRTFARGLAFLVIRDFGADRPASDGEHTSTSSQPKSDQGDAGEDHVDDAMRAYMQYVMLPLWFVPGLLDWAFHRQTKIERTSGTHESLTHSAMMSIIGVPILGALLLEVNALVLVTMMGAYAAHQAVAFWDVKYAKALRHVSTLEQQTHSFLEVLPFMGVSLASILKWRQFLAIFGAGPEPARWKIEPKRRPLSPAYIAAVLGGVALFVVAPYAEELVRCYRVDHSVLPHDEPIE
jgi:hypothetical protein